MTTYSAADASLDQLKTKINERQARIGIIGLGYVGLPLALLYSEQKFKVTGFDIDARKVNTLASGGSYIYRIAPEEIQAAQKQGFSATADYSQLEIDGCNHHLRSHAVERVPRARSQFYNRHRAFHRSTPASRTIGRAGEHDLSRNHGRGDDSDSRKRE